MLSLGPNVKKWGKNDDIWVEHSEWNLKCIFTLLYKGNQFIENVKRESIKHV